MTAALAWLLLLAFLGLGALAWRTGGFLAGLVALIGTAAAAGVILAGVGRATATIAVELLAAFALIGVVLLGLAALANRLLGDGERAED